MKQVIGATLKSNDGVCDFTFHLPSGSPYIVRFTSKDGGDATAYVPKVLTYVDDFGKTKIVIENLPQFLLDKYKHVELVSIKEEDEIKKDVIVDKKKPVEKVEVTEKEETKEKKK
jgi:alpha-N-acetylglucosamine transferase